MRACAVSPAWTIPIWRKSSMVTSAPKTFSMLPAGSRTSMSPFAPIAPTRTSALQDGPAGKRAGSIPTIVSRTRSGSCKRASPVAGGKPGKLGASPATKAREPRTAARAFVAGAKTTFGTRLLVTIMATAIVLPKNRDIMSVLLFSRAFLPGADGRMDPTHDVRHVLTGEKTGDLLRGRGSTGSLPTLSKGEGAED